MSKHTPGPWEANNGEVTTEREPGRSFRRIAAVQDYGLGSLKEVDDANARLIAAAPEMLEALIDILIDQETEPGNINTWPDPPGVEHAREVLTG